MVKVKTQAEVNHMDELDRQINDLIEQVKLYRNQSGHYKEQYFDALKSLKELQIEVEAQHAADGGIHRELVSQRKITQSNEKLAEEFRKRYEEQLGVNTDMRKKMNELQLLLQ